MRQSVVGVTEIGQNALRCPRLCLLTSRLIDQQNRNPFPHRINPTALVASERILRGIIDQSRFAGGTDQQIQEILIEHTAAF